MIGSKVCPDGSRPMRIELSGRLVGGKADRVVLWYCEACDRAEYEVRLA